MRLKSIKLAGFKSFVEPTTIPFPANMTAIVGPNGCGKSNIIDAVRWVMGESSAKHLRGEAMSDVIFNGSSARQPVGQASIELVFDNSNGSAPGDYARFSEISVRRRVTREGQSEYFMNATKCRRRDITDLFLGTGLGPRSYAIIEQGMISRLIEARPEELRHFIEEAAGISRYKERRRETENRMNRTLENIDRLTDLRDELDRQLQHLEKQAQTAEQYKTLKQQERQKQAELAALRWLDLEASLQSHRSAISEGETSLEKALSERTSHETALESLRQGHSERTERFNEAQGRYYEAGAEIARVEQSLDNQRNNARQTAHDLSQARDSRREVLREMEQDEEKLESVKAELTDVEPQLDETNDRVSHSSEYFTEAENRMSDWQQRWEDFSQRAADDRQEAEVEQSRIKASEAALAKLHERRHRLQEERAGLESDEDGDAAEQLAAEREEYEARCGTARVRVDELAAQVESVREQIEALEPELNASREKLQQLNGRLASERALLEDQMGDNDDAIRQWIRASGWEERPRVVQAMEVEAGWEKAVEAVLGPLAHGLALAPGEYAADRLSEAPGGVAIVDDRSEGNEAVPGESLLVRVSNAAGVAPLLASVLVAQTLEDAMIRRVSLADHESLVTPGGALVGRHWIRLPADNHDDTGLIERQKRVEQFETDAQTLRASVVEADGELQSLRESRDSTETLLAQARSELGDAREALSDVESRLGAHRARMEQIRERARRIREDLADLESQESGERSTLEAARARWQEAKARMEENADQKETLLAERDELREKLDHWRQETRDARDHEHRLQLQVQALKNQKGGLEQTLERMQAQRQRLDERVSELEQARDEAGEPIENLEKELQALLEHRVDEEKKLGEARQALEQIDQQVREREASRSAGEQRVQEARERLEQLRMDAQALELRGKQQMEQLDELDVSLDSVRAGIPDDATEQGWEKALRAIARRIERLGAINLAAIDEYRSQSERKSYLDEQDQDLREALEALESAIKRIDRETRNRFRETFHRINEKLQALFPRVFGGGSAHLEMTGDDLLETGVAIMARPPGKKNTSIHLLSGGEKALTAIALIFAIFQLNPAPFCMLDEVDAPLDDANVARYARMVKEMSEHVQFISITHNKISMELSDQLMGVTMQEPGISRLVSVDLEAAAVLVET